MTRCKLQLTIVEVDITCMIGPDGIYYDCYDGPVGRHIDRWFWNHSGTNDIMHSTQ